MMKKLIIFLPLFLFAKVVVAMSANLSYVMKDLKKAFENEFKEKVEFIISSSGKLTSQILNGAPYDVFLSADIKYPLFLYKKGVAYTKPVVYTNGVLVYYSKKGISLKNAKSIAIANPKFAPYGKAALKVLKEKKRLIYAPSVAVAYFYSQNSCDGAFLPKSAVINKDGLIKEYNIKIPQAMVLINKKASNFFVFMLSKKVQNILRKYGYSD